MHALVLNWLPCLSARNKTLIKKSSSIKTTLTTPSPNGGLDFGSKAFSKYVDNISGWRFNLRKWSNMKPRVAALASHFASNRSHPPSLLSAGAGCMVKNIWGCRHPPQEKQITVSISCTPQQHHQSR